MKLIVNLDIIQEQRKHTSLVKIANLMGVNYQALKARMRRKGYKSPIRCRDYSFLTTADKAYIAGIIDGEGHIDLRFKKVDVSNTNNDLIQWLIKKVGGFIVVKPNYNVKHKKSWSWRLAAVGSRGLLKEILPYLIIKKETAEKLLNLPV
jgi:hypothetical protein